MKSKNILAIISYSGKNYHGWQVQKNSLSVQEIFQKALKKIFKIVPDIKGCSRTDAGVHANMYAVNFNAPENFRCENIKNALNTYLPKDIAVKNCREVSDNFHSRYSCKKKQYIYKIWNSSVRNPFLDGFAYHYWYPLDINLLNETAQKFVGLHDFTSFCTLDKRKPENMVREIFEFSVKKTNDLVEFKIAADGFLYNMVRILIGTLLRVAERKIKKNDIQKIIDSKNRALAGPTVPSCGLYLNEVVY